MFSPCSYSLRALTRCVGHAKRPLLRSQQQPSPPSCFYLTTDSTTTYYDSQSGQHVRLHNENQIQIYLQASYEITIPTKLYKEDEESLDIISLLQRQKEALSGLVVRESSSPHHRQNLETLVHLRPENFWLWAYGTDLGSNKNTSILADYNAAKNGVTGGGTTADALPQQQHTTLVLGNDCLEEDPILVANQIASYIDDTKTGSVDHLWLSMESNDTVDETLQLTEELLYLDLPGATMQSRLVVTAASDNDDELVEELMARGVNKFVVKDSDGLEGKLESVKQIAKEQGKTVGRA